MFSLCQIGIWSAGTRLIALFLCFVFLSLPINWTNKNTHNCHRPGRKQSRSKPIPPPMHQIKKYTILQIRFFSKILPLIIIVKVDELSSKSINKYHTTVPVYFVTPIICLLCKYSTRRTIIRGNMSRVDNHWLAAFSSFFLLLPSTILCPYILCPATRWH